MHLAVLGQENAPSESKAAPAKFPALEFRKWSGDINVPDPVAVSVDSQGRVFATQTRRRKIQDLDIRANSEWIPDDVGLTSIEDKRDFFKRVLAIGGDDQEQRKHVDDWNGDGVHDWRDLTVVSEVVYRLVDVDQDGTADEITVFAEDFQTEVTGIAAGVLAFRDDVYVTVAPDLWKLRDHDADGRADSRESIAHGFGLHIAYGGHDMHGPTVGPDGKIYWSIGDKGINVTTATGQQFAYPNQGGVMRCNPDGSDFEVFAHGLRNVQEVAFDDFGNMFGVDNDSDQPRERERFVYIVDGMDAGWRNNYQYRGNSYNPWTDERLWELPEPATGENHPAYIIPPIQHYIDGPAGFKFNPGTALAPEYKDFFFVTGAPNGNQHAFRVERDGDSFRMVDEHQIGSGLAIVGLAFGPDGGLYGADWDGGYPLDEKGSVVRIDVADAQDTAIRREVRELIAAGFNHRDTTELVGLLGHADQRIRQGAQFALVDADAGDVLAGVVVDKSAGTLKRLHALWGLGQLARRGDSLGRDMVGLMLKDSDEQVRAQAAKTFGELNGVNPEALIDLLDDDSLHVRTLAGIALGRQPAKIAVEKLLEKAQGLEHHQHYLRHSLVSALAACAVPAELAAEAKHADISRKLCCLLALRRLGHASVADFLNDPSEWIAAEAARAIHDDLSIADALPQLANAILERSSPNDAFSRRAVNANYRIGDAEAANRLLQFATSDRPADGQRLDALQALAQWKSPPRLDRVDGRRRELSPEGRTIDVERMSSGLAKLAESSNQKIRAASLAAARNLEIKLPFETLSSLALAGDNDTHTRVEAINSLASASSPEHRRELRELLNQTFEAKDLLLQSHSLELLTEHFPAAALKRIEEVIEKDFQLPVRQTAVACLGELPAAKGTPLLQKLGQQLVAGELDSALALDVQQAILKAGSLDELSQQLSADRFAYSRDGGDAQRGKDIFNNHVQAQCSRCHRVGSEGSNIGPELTKIAQTRDADYLLRAIAQPSADIDEKYRSQVLLLASGQIVKGVVQSQDEEQTIIADANGNLQTIETDEIEDSTIQKVSLMPEMAEILSDAEVRDLVAYLRTLKGKQ